MNNFIKKKIDLNFYDTSCSSQLQKLKYLFKFEGTKLTKFIRKIHI